MDQHILAHTLRAIRYVDSPDQAKRREDHFWRELEALEARRPRRRDLVRRSRSALATFVRQGTRDWATRLEGRAVRKALR